MPRILKYRLPLIAVFLLLGLDINVNMDNFKEFFAYPDDENDQVKISWMPKAGVKISAYYLEKSRDNQAYEVWKKTRGMNETAVPHRFLEVDFEPYEGWSYYRIREQLENGEENTTPSIPVFLGIERLRKGELIVPVSPAGKETKKISLFDYDGLSFILVLRDQNGDEYLYDQKIRVSERGVYIEEGSGLPPGTYTITASSKDELIGLNILVD